MFDLSVQVDPGGVPEGLTRLAHRAGHINDQGARRGAQAIRAALKARHYPPQSHAPMRFVSEQQRRYVMMLVRSGHVPYRRTGKLASSWHVQRNGVAEYVVANSQLYAVFVIGDEFGSGQAWYHEPTWWKAVNVVNAYVYLVRDAVEAEWIREIGGSF